MYVRQNQQVRPAPARTLVANHSRAVARALVANHSRAVAWSLMTNQSRAVAGDRG